MKKSLGRIAILTSLLLFTLGCTTIEYATNSDYVGFSYKGVSSAQQSKKTDMISDDLYSTYDDEFVYDEDGNLIKHIQTNYFDNGEKFDEYIVTYQKIGEYILPESVAVNGVVYMDVEYDLLPTDHEGRIRGYTSDPTFFRRERNVLLFKDDMVKWQIDIANFDVPFRSDGKFVSTEESFAFFTGLSTDKVLTIGYDNIVLKRFYYSPAKFRSGYDISLGMGSSEPREVNDDASRNTVFTYEWDVIGGEIVQTGMMVKETLANLGGLLAEKSDFITFSIEREFDDSGRRISELWKILDSAKNPDETITIYSQELNY